MRRSPQRHALKGTALLSGLLFLAVSACDGSSDRVVDAPSGPGGGGTGDTLPELNAEQDGLAIERLEIAHEGIKAVPGAAVAGVA